MTNAQIQKEDRRKAKQYEREGIQAYRQWDIDQALKNFEAAARIAPREPRYRLLLARTLARGGDFDRALKVLAEFMRLQPDSSLNERFELLFASGMDGVEQTLTEKMMKADLPIEEIGAALQMWIEYRIALGSDRLIVRKPETWAAALDYTVRKVNLRPVRRYKLAEFYGISDSALRNRHRDLVDVLDVMPCDYRYFTGPDNPLDKLVEAAELLEELEARFQEP
jgi:tetratricopeptide (TPR) repeat protein